jgi:hypothetical protein
LAFKASLNLEFFMASPFQTLRKYQFAFFVFFGVVCMLVFVIGDPLDTWLRSRSSSGQRSGNEVVVTWNGGEMRESEIGYTQSVRNIIRQFFGRLMEEVQKKNGVPQVQPLQFSPSEEDIVYTRLLAQRAEERGMKVSDKTALAYMEELTNRLIPLEGIGAIFEETVGDKITEQQLLGEIKLGLLARNYIALTYPDLMDGQLPIEAWQYHQRLNRRIVAEVLPVEVAKFKEKVTKEPSNVELEALYNAGKDRYPEPASPNPGFKRHRKAAFEYVKADRKKFEDEEFAKLKPQITDQEIQEYYDKNKQEFRIPEEPAANPATPAEPGKTDANKKAENDPASTPPATNPADNSKSEPSAEKSSEKKSPDKESPNKSTENKPAPEKATPEKSADKSDSKSGSKSDSPSETKSKAESSENPSPGDAEDKKDTDKKDTDKEQPKSDGANSDCGPTADPDTQADGQTEAKSDEKSDAVANDAKKEDSTQEEKASAKEADKKDEENEDPEKKGEPAKKDQAQQPDKKEDAKKEAPAKQEEAVTKDKPAEDSKADSPASSAPGTNPTTPTQVPPEPKYKPLDDTLKEEIREKIARQKAAQPAQQRIDKGFSEIKRAVEKYARDKRSAELSNKAAPASFDLAKLAESHGMAAGSVPLSDPNKVQETELGKTRGFDFASMRFEPIPFADLAYRDGVLPYKPETISGSTTDGNQNTEFLYWKTKEEPPFVPSLEEIRQEVVDAWKLREALVLAEAEAKTLAEKARASGKSLKETFPEPERKVAETNQFSWMNRGFLPANMGGMPTLSSVENVEHAGNDFMESVFGLKPGEVSTAVNQPHTVVYVVRVKSEFPSEDALREQFLQTGNSGELQQIAMVDKMDLRRDWIEAIRRDLNVQWARDPQS